MVNGIEGCRQVQKDTAAKSPRPIACVEYLKALAGRRFQLNVFVGIQIVRSADAKYSISWWTAKRFRASGASTIQTSSISVDVNSQSLHYQVLASS